MSNKDLRLDINKGDTTFSFSSIDATIEEMTEALVSTGTMLNGMRQNPERTKVACQCIQFFFEKVPIPQKTKDLLLSITIKSTFGAPRGKQFEYESHLFTQFVARKNKDGEEIATATICPGYADWFSGEKTLREVQYDNCLKMLMEVNENEQD